GASPLRRYRTRLITDGRVAASKWCRFQDAGRRGRERTSYVTDHNDAADNDDAPPRRAQYAATPSAGPQSPAPQRPALGGASSPEPPAILRIALGKTLLPLDKTIAPMAACRGGWQSARSQHNQPVIASDDNPPVHDDARRLPFHAFRAKICTSQRRTGTRLQEGSKRYERAQD
ncbi:MAG: hypothetical protein FWC40_05915, partial [Proteobacteria bacterium]|nr:hypothetical protein [Pseudomonadota bacterium]